MKKFFLSLFLLLCFCVFANASNVRLATNQTSTGASAVACTIPNYYEDLTVIVTRSGTSASIEVECNYGDGTFYALTGSGLPITGTSAQRSIISYACYQVRVNVTACTACTVNAWCAWTTGAE